MFTDARGRLYPAWAFLLSALLCCAAFFVSGYLAGAIAGDHVLRFELIFRSLLAVVLLGGFSWLLTVGDHIESDQLAAQGLPMVRESLRQFAFGCGLGFVLIILAVSALALFGQVSFRTTITGHALVRSIAVLFVLLTGSLAEELMFRGYPFQRLVEAIGALGAMAVFSVLFALVHILNPGATVWGLIDTVVIGIALSVAYLRTRALWLPWGFHFAWNTTLGLLCGLPVSGIRFFNVLVHTTASGPRWLTGGAYGLEASVPGASAVIVALVVLWRAPVRLIRKYEPTPAVSPVPVAEPDVNAPSHDPSDLGI
jgi:membrane protease YdiL (CAAX protease family)